MNDRLDFTTSVRFMASDSSSTVSIPLGITIGLLASFIQSLGLTIQRKSHVQNQALPEDQRRVEHRRPLWLLGFAIFISSNLFGSLVQIASLPVVILAPLGAVSLLWNAFFARMLLGDAFSIWMIFGTLLIAGGAVMIAVFGIVPEPTHSLEDLLILFSRPAFVVYFSLLGIFVVGALIITHLLEYSYARRMSMETVDPPLSPLLAPNTAPTILTTAITPSTAMDTTTAVVTERTPLIDNKVSRPTSPSDAESLGSSSLSNDAPLSWSERMPTLLAMSYASFSGIISGMCLLFAKSGVELLVLTIAGKNQFWRWQAWVLVGGLVVCALLQLWYMHKGLVLANPTLICPLAFCFYNLSSIVNGLVYFDQFSLLPTSHLCFVMLGMAILLAGVWIVSLPPSGGYRVDVTRWDEHRAAAARVDEESSEVYDDEPLPMVPPRTSYTEPSSPVVARSSEDSAMGLGLTFEDGRGQYGSLPLPISSSATKARGGGLADSALLSDVAQPRVQSPETIPRRPRATSTLPTSSSISTQNTQHLTIPQRQLTQSGHYGYPFPLSPGATQGTLGGGFSIGLSPISPGFALVPRRKRRRTGSSAGDIVSPAIDDVSLRGRGRRRESMRRVVSDGGVHSPINQGDEERTGLLNEDDHQSFGGDESGHGHAPPGGAKMRARDRWNWLRGVFSSSG